MAFFTLGGIANPSHAQRLRFGGFGGGPGWSLQTPSFSIGVSPFGGTRITTPYGTRRYRVDPFSPPVDFSSPRRSAYPDFYRGEARNRYSAPQDRYSAPQDRYRALPDRYGFPSPYSPRSPYSSGASMAPRGALRPAAPDRNLPFARSPYDASPPTGFGITGTAPAASLSERELKRELIRSAETLAGTLDDTADGDIWQEFLQPSTIAAVLQNEASPATITATLRPRWDHFRGTAGNPELTWVTRLDGFSSTYRLLEEWMRRRQPDAVAPSEEAAPYEVAPPSETTTPDTEADRNFEEIPPPLPEPRRPQAAPSAAEAPGAASDGSDTSPRKRYAL